jgi:AcrR family transcriptional regulator
MIDLESEAAIRQDPTTTRELLFNAAERLFALRGLQAVSVRDITAEAGVNLASLNYYFRSKDTLLLEIFERRFGELNHARGALLDEATARHDGHPPLAAILDALVRPPVEWLDPQGERFIAIQFLIRARAEGTEDIRSLLRGDVSHLRRFAEALHRSLPGLALEEVYWRLHFVLGMIYNNCFSEFDRLAALSDGQVQTHDLQRLVTRMVGFAEAGFQN